MVLAGLDPGQGRVTCGCGGNIRNHDKPHKVFFMSLFIAVVCVWLQAVLTALTALRPAVPAQPPHINDETR